MRPTRSRRRSTGHDGPAIVCAQVGRGEHRAPSTRSREIAERLPRRPAPGFTSTARSGCGPRRRPSSRQLRRRASSARTRGRRTRTSGSTFPYDCGLAFVADPRAHRAAMATDGRVPRRRGRRRARRDGLDARVLAARARVRGLRRAAVARDDPASRSSSSAAARTRGGSRTSSAQLPGCEVLNEVVLNQVLFRFERRRDDGRACSRRSRRAAKRG